MSVHIRGPLELHRSHEDLIWDFMIWLQLTKTSRFLFQLCVFKKLIGSGFWFSCLSSNQLLDPPFCNGINQHSCDTEEPLFVLEKKNCIGKWALFKKG